MISGEHAQEANDRGKGKRMKEVNIDLWIKVSQRIDDANLGDTLVFRYVDYPEFTERELILVMCDFVTMAYEVSAVDGGFELLV